MTENISLRGDILCSWGLLLHLWGPGHSGERLVTGGGSEGFSRQKRKRGIEIGKSEVSCVSSRQGLGAITW